MLVLASLATVVGVYYVSSVPLPDALRLPATTTVYYSDGIDRDGPARYAAARS